jgi:hypothetical protein
VDLFNQKWLKSPINMIIGMGTPRTSSNIERICLSPLSGHMSDNDNVVALAPADCCGKARAEGSN